MSHYLPSSNINQYVFYWDDEIKEYDNNLSTYNEMILTIRNLFKQKISEEMSIKIFYIDVDEDSFEIHSQNEFMQVHDYHSKMLGKNEIKLKIIGKNFDISTLLSSKFGSSKINKSISCVDFNENFSMMPKNKRALIGENLGNFDNLSLTISKEFKSMKDLMTANNQEMKNYFQEILENKISKYQAEIERLNKENVELKTKIKKAESNRPSVFKISKESEIVFISESSSSKTIRKNNKDKNIKKNHNDIKEYGHEISTNIKYIDKVFDKKGDHSQNHIKESKDIYSLFLQNDLQKEIYICTICFENNAKFVCVLCENLYLCNSCEYIDSHSNHPRVSLSDINHFKIENLSKTVFSMPSYLKNVENSYEINYDNFFSKKNKFDFGDKRVFYYNMNKDFFCKKLSPLKLEIAVSADIYEKDKSNDKDDSKILRLGSGKHLDIPIKITNLSNQPINPYELLITFKNYHPFTIENKSINTKIKKNGTYETSLNLKAGSNPGKYDLEMQIFHILRRVEFIPSPVIISINILEEPKLTTPVIKKKSDVNEIKFK